MTVRSVFVGLGSNVGDRLAHLQEAVRRLAAADGILFVRASAVYETDPVGPPQDDFLNAVVEVHTELGAREVLAHLKRIEGEVGRTPAERWGPREVDLDLLLYGADEVTEEGLRVPHPEMPTRAFVLVPLADVAPFADIPGAGLVAALLEGLDTSGVRHAHRSEVLWPPEPG